LVQLSGQHGTMIVRAVVTDRVGRGTVFTPMHWSDQFAAHGRTGSLLQGNVDPVSGQPELKHGVISIGKFQARWYAFAASCEKPAPVGTEYWALARAENGWRIELADTTSFDGDRAGLVDHLWPQFAGNEVLSYRDRARGEERFAVFDGATLLAVLFVSQSPVACDRTHVLARLGQSAGDGLERLRILAGRSGGGDMDAGPTICACLGISRNRIMSAIVSNSGCSVELIGKLTGAGTNCGSCRAEIGGLIDATRAAKAG
jgi:assimilatory nitrate reductase catalytic subunit